MAEKQSASATARPPLIAKKPPVPWWKQRSKRQPRKMLVNKPRRREKAVGKNPPPQAQAQTTEGATQATLSRTASSVSATQQANGFKKRRRKKPKLLVLDSWVNDGTVSPPLDAPADEEEVVLDSWENESLTQPSTGSGANNDGGCGLEKSSDHVTNNSSTAAIVAEKGQSDVNNTVKVYGQVDQGLSANELQTIFRRKRRKGRVQRKINKRQKRLAALNAEHSESLVKIEPAVKSESPSLISPPPLLKRPPIQPIWSSASSVAPRTSTVDVLKNLPPFSGLTSSFDSSLSDHIHTPPDFLPIEQSVDARLYPSHSRSSISDCPLPLLDSGDLTNRGNPFKDTITPLMPLRRVTPEEISTRRDSLQLPGYNTSSTRTSSLNPNLIVLSPITKSRSFTRSSSTSLPLLPTPLSSARSPPPTLRGGGGPSRQLKITSFLSPPKKRLDDLIRLEPEYSTSLTMSSAGQVGLSTRPPPLSPERPKYSGATLLPPVAPRDSYFPASELRDSSSVPLSRLSNQDSVFHRLDSPTKYQQSRLQFSSDPSRSTLELAPPLRDIHDDPFSRLGPSVTSRNALSMSQFGDSYASGSGVRVLSPSEIDQRRPHFHTDHLYVPVDTRPLSDVVVKLETDIKYEDSPTSSSCLYQTRPDGLNVTKILNRFAPKRYPAIDISPRPQPSTSFALVKQEREVKNVLSIDSQQLTASSDGERFVDIQDSVRNVRQIPGPSQDSERTVTEAGVSLINTGQDGATGFHVGGDDFDYPRYVQSTGIHIPLSKKGLKVIAIDCEMVGCIRRMPRERLLASHMKGAMKGGIGVTKAAQGNKGGGIGGVLHKTQMKPQVKTRNTRKKKGLNKECSVVARCSIIGYDSSVLYDKYINPTIGTNYTITNYRTPWSGIKPCHMVRATPFHVARREILDILQGCIVVGHNIGSDFQSLEIHNFPASQIRDTSFHPTLKSAAGGSRALKKMAHILLGRNIQTKSRVGHCSVEDATATMDLYKLVELEWEN